MATTLFLVEDDPRLRHYLVELLSGEPTLQVVGSAGTGAEAIAQIGKLTPQLATEPQRGARHRAEQGAH